MFSLTGLGMDAREFFDFSADLWWISKVSRFLGLSPDDPVSSGSVSSSESIPFINFCRTLRERKLITDPHLLVPETVDYYQPVAHH